MIHVHVDHILSAVQEKRDGLRLSLDLFMGQNNLFMGQNNLFMGQSRTHDVTRMPRNSK